MLCCIFIIIIFPSFRAPVRVGLSLPWCPVGTIYIYIYNSITRFHCSHCCTLYLCTCFYLPCVTNKIGLDWIGRLNVRMPSRRLCRSAWVGFSSPFVCLFVRSITQKRMIPVFSVQVFKLGTGTLGSLKLGYPRSGTVLGFKGQRSRSQGQ